MRLIVLLLIFSLSLVGQDSITLYTDTVLILPSEQEVKDRYNIDLEPRPGVNSISEQLRNQSVIDTKIYGSEGAVSSVSVRGLSSSHTVVNWDGINLNSLTLGSFNFGRESAFGHDQISLNYNPSITLDGAGAIGASINLQTHPKYNEGFKASFNSDWSTYSKRHAEIDSLNINNNYQGQVAFSGKKMIIKHSFSFLNSPNVYVVDSIEVRRQEQFYRNTHKTDFHYMFNQKQNVFVSYWGVQSDKSLRPSFYNQYQQDTSHRVMAGYNYLGDKLSLKYRLAFLHEMTHYSAIDIDTKENVIDSRILTQSIRQILNASYMLDDQWSLDFGFRTGYNQADVSAYGDLVSLTSNSSALLLRYKPVKKVKLILGCRYDYYLEYQSKGLMSISGFYDINKNLTLSISADQKYRIPTFNDLYWTPGGNINLKPEEGWGTDLSVRLNKDYGKASFSWMMNLFYINLNNWIRWSPTGQGYWAPESLMNVFSAGNENRWIFNFDLNKCNLSFIQDYSFTKTMIMDIEEAYKNYIGNQLPYTPMHRSRSQVLLKTQFGLNLSYTADYTSKRYTANDNNEIWSLDPVLLHDIHLSFDHNIKRHKVYYYTEIKNVTNKEYKWVSGFPMPGRLFRIGIKININDKVK